MGRPGRLAGRGPVDRHRRAAADVIATGPVEIGIDIGGTFTDVVCRRVGEPMRIAKIRSTRGDPARAVMQAVAFMVPGGGAARGNLGRFRHGTTIATNAVLERSGARIGLLTTA